MSDTGDSRERRLADRQEAQFPCQLTIGEAVVEGTTRNLSLGGLLFEPGEPGKPEWQDQASSIAVVIGSLPYEAECMVVRVGEDGVGIRFNDISDTAFEDVIFDLINEQLEGI